MEGTTWHCLSRKVWILCTCMNVSGSSCYRLNGGNHMALSEEEDVDPLYRTTCMKVSGSSCYRFNPFTAPGMSYDVTGKVFSVYL